MVIQNASGILVGNNLFLSLSLSLHTSASSTHLSQDKGCQHLSM